MASKGAHLGHLGVQSTADLCKPLPALPQVVIEGVSRSDINVREAETAPDTPAELPKEADAPQNDAAIDECTRDGPMLMKKRRATLFAPFAALTRKHTVGGHIEPEAMDESPMLEPPKAARQGSFFQSVQSRIRALVGSAKRPNGQNGQLELDSKDIDDTVSAGNQECIASAALPAQQQTTTEFHESKYPLPPAVTIEKEPDLSENSIMNEGLSAGPALEVLSTATSHKAPCTIITTAVTANHRSETPQPLKDEELLDAPTGLTAHKALSTIDTTAVAANHRSETPQPLKDEELLDSPTSLTAHKAPCTIITTAVPTNHRSETPQRLKEEEFLDAPTTLTAHKAPSTIDTTAVAANHRSETPQPLKDEELLDAPTSLTSRDQQPSAVATSTNKKNHSSLSERTNGLPSIPLEKSESFSSNTIGSQTDSISSATSQESDLSIPASDLCAVKSQVEGLNKTLQASHARILKAIGEQALANTAALQRHGSLDQQRIRLKEVLDQQGVTLTAVCHAL
ncbi:hypothetical protein HDU67_002229, partial [Dinochytrium kinnereticum]